MGRREFQSNEGEEGFEEKKRFKNGGELRKKKE